MLMLMLTLANQFYIFVMSCLKVICWALIFIFKLGYVTCALNPGNSTLFICC